jgi:glutamate N-acetyltransferase/amino-acid N-acetyltransferase
MKAAEITIDIDIRLKSGKATVWTCDLTRGYIAINADYRS